MTFAMLPIGRSVSRSRLHSSPPVAAFASTPPFAFTPLGAPVTCTPGDAGVGDGFARAVWAARTSPPAAVPDACLDGADAAAEQATAGPARMLPAAAMAVGRTATRMTLQSASSVSEPAREYRGGLSRTTVPLSSSTAWTRCNFSQCPASASETWLQITRDLHTFHGTPDGFRGWAATIA